VLIDGCVYLDLVLLLGQGESGNILRVFLLKRPFVMGS
jgi:hypothetical protein